ncbi:DUF892 family protein [Mucilaginibacter sp.]|uniref:DUF892 family protein n=1 Tax=Mucilaginibacter sp. TaxID=1882438 RepID=UPI0035BC25FA
MPTTPQINESYLKSIFQYQLNRIYNGKCFLKDNLDHLISLASFRALQLAMGEFGSGVHNQISRMDDIYRLIGEKPLDTVGNPIKSIIKDEFFIDEKQTMPVLNDLDIILYVQLLEHVNITTYRMLIMIAKLLKYNEIKQLLTENFDESAENDQLFTLIAKEYITTD